jgi:hypothetical protein
MNRTDIINSLIEAKGLQSYLEIGVQRASFNHNLVKCERKVGVDPFPIEPAENQYLSTSDEFFDSNEELFDLIFIDGDHTEDQVDTDISNALMSLNHGGVIVLHDCLPPSEWHQRPSESNPELPWNGTTWKAVLRHFNSSPYLCYIVDCDWGCGVIDTTDTTRKPMIQLPRELNYDQHFELLKRYVISPEEFDILMGK